MLWLSAALAAVAFSLAATVRGETERTSSAVDGVRGYYLAAGAIDRAALELLWSAGLPAGAQAGLPAGAQAGRPFIPPGSSHVDYDFPGGAARVEIIPETAKLNVNLAPPDELYRLCVALGLGEARAREIAAAIIGWRSPSLDDAGLDAYYLSLTPSFRPPHASFQMIEELLLVKGVSPEIYYGTYAPNPDSGAEDAPRLTPRAGLADCLTVFGGSGQVDANTAQPAVLAAVGLAPNDIAAVLAARNEGPMTPDRFANLMAALGPAGSRLRVGGNTILTLRATARPRLPGGQLSDLRRTVAAQVKYMAKGPDPIHVLRWYGAPGSD
ncbi:MAG TPA: hypothetical protein VMU19_00270 [Bryobacteraceae bacterium]|nr:hypothetical protein [Bryobacteraceae bacterium]